MENNNVPIYTFELIMAQVERTIRRWWILCIILVALLLSTNAVWFMYVQQFEAVTETTQEVNQDTDGGGNNIMVGGDYGKTNH